jgi:glycosyltransferase involved in cell wall biosynthesis
MAEASFIGRGLDNWLTSPKLRVIQSPMRIIFICRHFPPEISGGARRPFLLVNALRARGHQVFVVTPFDTQGDPDRVQVIDPSIKRGAEGRQLDPPATPGLFQRIKGAVRTLLLWPDPDIRWANRVVDRLIGNPIDADFVITTNPPESSHSVGTRLKARLPVHWVADFRDTWTVNPHRRILETSRMRAMIERRLARGYLKTVDGIAAVSEVLLDEARNYARTGTPELVLPHFSEPLSDHQPSLSLPADKVNLVHTGSFSLSDRRRDLRKLLTVLEKGLSDNPALTFHIVGDLTEDELSAAEASPVEVVHHGARSLQESRQFQQAADGLILYTPEDSHALPGKYAEYAASGRPIYYLGSGSWLDLVKSRSSIRKLEDWVGRIPRGETVAPADFMTAAQAAEVFETFLRSLMPPETH